LPLNDDFAASFTCFSLDETGSGKPNPAGNFECYKLADNVEEIKYDKEVSVKEMKKKKQLFDEDKFWANFYNNT
jgi:hypothetical protein